MKTKRTTYSKLQKKAAAIMALSLAGSLLLGSPAFAAPSFSRTEEEWAKLRDNTLEYNELAGLIEEYNATVQKNNIELRDFRKKFGSTNATASKRYNEMADEILANLVEPDIDSPGYASALSDKASSLATVDNLRKSADTSLEDYDVNFYNFEQAKMSLIQIAQTNRINLDNAILSEENAKLALQKAELDLQNANVRLRAGVATNLDVLNAQESLIRAKKDLQSSEADTKNIRQKLIIMTGWAYNATPEITALPDMNFEEVIGSFSVEDDTKKAIENNYVLKANEKRLVNAKSADQRESLEKTIANNKSGIANAVLSASQNLNASKESYLYAQNNANLVDANQAITAKKYNLGMVSAYEMNSTNIAKQQADLAVKQAQLALRIAINNYEWNVHGLAKTE